MSDVKLDPLCNSGHAIMIILLLPALFVPGLILFNTSNETFNSALRCGKMCIINVVVQDYNHEYLPFILKVHSIFHGLPWRCGLKQLLDFVGFPDFSFHSY